MMKGPSRRNPLSFGGTKGGGACLFSSGQVSRAPIAAAISSAAARPKLEELQRLWTLLAMVFGREREMRVAIGPALGARDKKRGLKRARHVRAESFWLVHDARSSHLTRGRERRTSFFGA